MVNNNNIFGATREKVRERERESRHIEGYWVIPLLENQNIFCKLPFVVPCICCFSLFILCHFIVYYFSVFYMFYGSFLFSNMLLHMCSNLFKQIDFRIYKTNISKTSSICFLICFRVFL